MHALDVNTQHNVSQRPAQIIERVPGDREPVLGLGRVHRGVVRGAARDPLNLIRRELHHAARAQDQHLRRGRHRHALGLRRA